MTIIGLKELRQNASSIAERAKNGERFTVVKRSKPMFEIGPTSSGNTSVEDTRAWTQQFVSEHKTAFEALANK